jgi:DNA-binding transcriptional ArsR family regulator
VSTPPPNRLNEVFGALADPTRREILRLLSRDSRPVGALAEAFPVSRPAISKHLDRLERAGLVERVPEGRSNHCHLRAEPLIEALEWLAFYQTHWEGALARFAQFVENPEEER